MNYKPFAQNIAKTIRLTDGLNFTPGTIVSIADLPNVAWFRPGPRDHIGRDIAGGAACMHVLYPIFFINNVRLLTSVRDVLLLPSTMLVDLAIFKR